MNHTLTSKPHTIKRKKIYIIITHRSRRDAKIFKWAQLKIKNKKIKERK